MDTGNAVATSSFKTWRHTRVLPPSQRGGKQTKNQWLLRRCLEILTLQRGIQTHGAALSRSIGSQEPPPTSSGTSLPDRGVDKAPLMVHVMAERHRRVRLNALFAALRDSLPVQSKKSDKVSVLADILTYIEDLKREIRELKMNKSHVERQDEDLELPHQDLEKQNQKLEGSTETFEVGLVQEELKKSRKEKELVQQRGRLNLVDEQHLQSVTSVQELISMESDLEQALERVRTKKSYVSSTY